MTGADLNASRVLLVEEKPVGLALIARRGLFLAGLLVAGGASALSGSLLVRAVRAVGSTWFGPAQ